MWRTVNPDVDWDTKNKSSHGGIRKVGNWIVYCIFSLLAFFCVAVMFFQADRGVCGKDGEKRMSYHGVVSVDSAAGHETIEMPVSGRLGLNTEPAIVPTFWAECVTPSGRVVASRSKIVLPGVFEVGEDGSLLGFRTDVFESSAVSVLEEIFRGLGVPFGGELVRVEGLFGDSAGGVRVGVWGRGSVIDVLQPGCVLVFE